MRVVSISCLMGFERLQQTILDERMDGKHPSFEDWSWLKSQCNGILSAFRQTGSLS